MTSQLLEAELSEQPAHMPEYSAQVEHPDRFELNSLTAKTEQSSRRD